MIGFLIYFLYVLHILCCIILIAVVLMHESKGDSLASVFGGGGVDSAFGVQFGKKVSRFTVGAAVIFMVLTIIIGILVFRDKKRSTVVGPAPTKPDISGTNTGTAAPRNTGGATTSTGASTTAPVGTGSTPSPTGAGSTSTPETPGNSGG